MLLFTDMNNGVQIGYITCRETQLSGQDNKVYFQTFSSILFEIEICESLPLQESQCIVY